MSTAPPNKKRKLNDGEEGYVPSDADEQASDYAEQKEEELNSNSNDNGPWGMSAANEIELTGLHRTLNSFKKTQLMAVLKSLQSLRSIDGEAYFENISVSGKKEDLTLRIVDKLYMVYSEEVTVQYGTGWFKREESYKENIDFDSWKQQIKQSMNLIASQSSTKKRKKAGSSSHAALLSRLNACDKQQIIASLELLFNEQENGKDLACALEALLPKPNLQNIFHRHLVLIKEISKARPYTRYGSSSDHYCFKRCRPAINAAKKAIIADGKNVINSKNWDSCLEYLVVQSNNVKRFPSWDSAADNSAVHDLKKKLKVWTDKVKKGLAGKYTDIQQKRLQQLELFFNE